MINVTHTSDNAVGATCRTASTVCGWKPRPKH